VLRLHVAAQKAARIAPAQVAAEAHETRVFAGAVVVQRAGRLVDQTQASELSLSSIGLKLPMQAVFKGVEPTA